MYVCALLIKWVTWETSPSRLDFEDSGFDLKGDSCLSEKEALDPCSSLFHVLINLITPYTCDRLVACTCMHARNELIKKGIMIVIIIGILNYALLNKSTSWAPTCCKLFSLSLCIDYLRFSRLYDILVYIHVRAQIGSIKDMISKYKCITLDWSQQAHHKNTKQIRTEIRVKMAKKTEKTRSHRLTSTY